MSGRAIGVACAALALGAAGIPGQAHPPVTGVADPARWVTIGDFRHVTALAAGDAELYVGTAGGVEIVPFLAETPSTTVTAGDGLPTSAVTALGFDQAGGRLWVGTALGLAIYDPFRGDVVQDPLGLGGQRVDAIRFADAAGPDRRSPQAGPGSIGESRAFVRAGGRWWSADPFALRAEPARAGEVPPEPPAVDPAELPFSSGRSVRGERSGRSASFPVTAVEALPDGRIAIGTWGDNAHLGHPARLEAVPVRFGLAGPGGGAVGWDGSSLWFTNAPSGSPAGRGALPRAGVADVEGIAVADGELTLWRHEYPGLRGGLPSDRVHDLAFDGTRAILATEAGLAILEGEPREWRRVPVPAAAEGETLAVAAAADGLWLGMRHGLLALRHGSGGREGGDLQLAGRWLDGRAVRAVEADGREVWVGTDLGLFRLAPRTAGAEEWVLEEARTASPGVRDLVLLPGEVVVATDRGVEILPREPSPAGPGADEPERILVGEGRLDEPPLALAADSSNLWIGTLVGLSRWDRERRRWTEYGLADGLPDVPVTGLELQAGGRLWISTPGGAVRFDYGSAGGR